MTLINRYLFVLGFFFYSFNSFAHHSSDFLKDAKKELKDIVNGNQQLTIQDANSLKIAIKKEFQKFSYDLSLQPLPNWVTEKIEHNRLVTKFIIEARRKIDKLGTRVSSEFDKSFSYNYSYLSVNPRKRVPDDAKISVEAFISIPEVTTRFSVFEDPAIWLIWLDQDGDGVVSGYEYNAWSEYYPYGYSKFVSAYIPGDFFTDGFGLNKFLIPSAFHIIEEYLMSAQWTPAVRNSVFKPVTGIMNKLLKARPLVISGDLAIFRFNKYFPNYKFPLTNTNAVKLKDFTPSTIKHGYEFYHGHIYPVNFSRFIFNDQQMFLSGSGDIKSWDTVTKKWVVYIPGSYQGTLDNAGFRIGQKVYQFTKESTLQSYNLTSKEVKNLGNVPISKFDYRNVIVIKDTAFVLYQGDSLIQTFNSKSEEWGTIPLPPIEQLYPLLAKRDEKLLLVGGVEIRAINNEEWVWPIRITQEFDPKLGTWSRLEDIPRQVNSIVSKFHQVDGCGYIVGALRDKANFGHEQGFAYKLCN